MALGFGFRCGFLGLLHLEIIQERLEREYNLDLVTTAPGVVYRVYKTNGEMIELTNPSNLPDPSEIEYMEEPIVSAEIMVTTEYVGSIMTLCQERRGVYLGMEYIETTRALLKYELPLNEIIYDFFDALKSRSRGYASFDYEMLGYELQRNRVIANTRAMLEGNLVNNVLLYGDSGTGKSATVKNLLTLPGFEALRLIEVQKEGLADLPRLIRTLGGRRLKFILFIDDLAFDQDDKTYSALKTILEGGLERRPANVAVYATSNRRRLVRQTFSDRAGDEVDASETIQEKTSLSDRFGLRIPYLALNQAEFLELVEGMAEQAGIALDRDSLRAEAVKWEMRNPGRTPRTAKQFIASLSL